MIQRLQSVYLALTAILILIPMLLELSLASVGDLYLTNVSIYSTYEELHKVASSFPITIGMTLGLLLSIYSIMQFKNRKFQMKLVQLAMVLQLGIAILVFVYADKMVELAQESEVSYSPILIGILVNIVLYYLALRGIKKDEALVRSADRLR